jgi:hypothetical protein
LKLLGSGWLGHDLGYCLRDAKVRLAMLAFDKLSAHIVGNTQKLAAA